MNEDEARWAAYLGLPYDKEYAPDTKIRFEHDKDYPDRQYQGVSKRAKNEIRKEVIPEAKRIKDEYGKEWIQVLDERGIFGNDSTIYHPRETYTGDLGKFGIREVGNSGIYEIGDKYDFPSWVPVPDRNEGTELMIRDTIWSDRANPKLYNKEIIKRKNKHSIGGLLGKLGDWNTNVTNSMFTNSNTGQATGFDKFAKGFGIDSGNIGGIANTAATAIGGLLAGKNKTGVGSAMQTVGSLASNIPGVGGLIGAGVNMVGGLVNAAFGSNINKEFVNQTEAQARQQSNYLSGATDTTSLLSDWDALTFLGDIKKSDVGSDGWFSNKAGRETDRLNTLVDEANMRALASLSNTAENIDKQNDLMLMANYSAYGGPIDMKYTGVMSPFGNQFKDGGIYIKPSKSNKYSLGGDFSNGVIQINSGGLHSTNPYEGVQMGVDPQGIPNLVEEGEVIYDDYVFSNRLRVPKEVRQKYKLRGVTFADAAKQLQKESEERPNDPISKRGLEASMKMLMSEQEMIRDKKENNKYAKGGRVNKCAEGSWLYKPINPGFIPSKDDILAEMESMYPSLLGESMLPIASKIEGSTAFKDQLGIKGEEQSSKVAPMKTSWLRYAPIVGSGLAVANDLFGGNEPDYTNADMFERAIEGTNRPIRARQIGNYLTYRPLDRDYYINKLNANTSASRRGIVNTSGGNRAAAMAGLLATDYNYGNQLGDLARQAEEYNLAQRQKVEEFNRGTNVTNAEMAMKADLANAEQAMQRARMYGSLAEYRDAIRAKNRAEKSANLTNFIQGLGDLGTELTDKDKLRWLAELGVLKYDASGKYTGDKKSNVGAKGSRINRKKRGGFTI